MSIQPRLYYNYAEIDPETNMCVGVMTSSYGEIGGNYVSIPVYDEEYIFKYYINGVWYEDEAGTISWVSSLI